MLICNIFVASDRISPICLPVTRDLQERNFVGLTPFIGKYCRVISPNILERLIKKNSIVFMCIFLQLDGVVLAKIQRNQIFCRYFTNLIKINNHICYTIGTIVNFFYSNCKFQFFQTLNVRRNIDKLVN